MKINIVEYFKQTVATFPNRIALNDNNTKYSFQELDFISDKIALNILKINKEQRKPIAVLLPKSNESIISFIGILKTGNFYVPIDIKSPIERISKIISTLMPECVISNKEGKKMLDTFYHSGNVLCIEDLQEINQTNILDEVREQIIDLDPIYAIFTSGSTGVPKGVVISHRGVIDYIEWARKTYQVSENDVIGNQAPFYFDNSTLDIYLMICTGASLNIIPEFNFTFPIKLIEYINDNQINMVFWVPSVLVNVANFDVLSSLKPKYLNKILFAGEAMPNKHLNYWRKHYPNALYSNLYGPTEITVDCTFYNVDRKFSDDESLPIGKACKNTQILIFNTENQLTKEGEIGELCVRGSSLAFGYYNDYEKTKQAFVQNPLHNHYPDIIYKTGDLVYINERQEIIFVGRKDSQIKHMGYRIELGEIENAILGCEGVDNVAVLYDDTKKEIVSFLISQEDINVLRKDLLKKIPKYMIPTRWEIMKEFPLNANGKINRLELKKLF